MRHTISVLVENKFGVLARVAGLFSARGYNISSLAVSETLDPNISYMTIVVEAKDENVLEQIKKQLNKLIDVLTVMDFTKKEHVERELILAKINYSPKDKEKIEKILNKYLAKLIQHKNNIAIIEASGEQNQIKQLLEALNHFGIKELVRTGRVAMAHYVVKREEKMLKIYYDNDADLDILKDKTIAIIGYGIQGRGQALCLRDSGCRVIVSELEGTPNFDQAKKDGFAPVSAEEAAKAADIIQILTQDHVQAKVYKESIKPNLKKGRPEGGGLASDSQSHKALCFSHGFNIRFKQIKPPKNVDVFMVAPKGPGALVRRMYEEGKGVPSLVAVYQNATGDALKLALAYAKAIRATRAGVIETTFDEETETDLFGEQAVLCGGVTELIKAGFDTLIEAGYQPEIAYFEVLHELKLITDLIQETGISGMRRRVSNTACYGDLTRGPKIITQKTRKAMQKILKEVKSGKFAREWIKENEQGRPNFNRLLEEGDKHKIEEVGKKLREMMPWMKK